MNTTIDYDTENLLALRWRISQDSVSYQGLVFEIGYTVSDYIRSEFVTYAIYDGPGCSASANFITHLGYFNSSVTESETATGLGIGDKQLTLSTHINAATIKESSVYIENGDDAEIKFCVRLSLMSSDASDPTATEINHMETSMGLRVDLKDSFEIQGQVVTAIDKGVETAEDSFFVEAFVCNEDGLRILDSISYLQGQTVTVCVKPTAQALDIGFRMASIDRFTFWQGYVSQEAVVGGRKAINGLTNLDCTRGYEVCVFETLLNAAFFQGPSTVDGTGFASLQFGSDVSRQLDSDEESDDYVHRDLKARPRSLELEQFQIQRVSRPRRSSTAAKGFQRGFWLIPSLAALMTHIGI